MVATSGSATTRCATSSSTPPTTLPWVRAEQRIIPGSNSRPADLLLPVEGELWVCDFAVTHPIQPLYVDGTADVSMPVNFAAERYGADVKDARYSAGFFGVEYPAMSVQW